MSGVTPIFGTAHLFGLVAPERSVSLLKSAYTAGFRYFDTAPSYGFGDSEPAVRTALADSVELPLVSTKVGILAGSRPSGALRLAKAAARRLPGPVQQRLRGEDGPAGHGHFEPDEVRGSIETSLRRLGRVDRLLLHEVTPDDITDELLTILTTYRDRGDVGTLGVATGNELTAACVARAPDVLRVVHIAVGPLSPPVVLSDGVTVIGHGALGAGGAQLRVLTDRLRADPELTSQWQAAAAGTRFAGTGGLADALVARAAGAGPAGIIVATSNPARLAGLVSLISEPGQLTADLAAVLDRLIAAS